MTRQSTNNEQATWKTIHLRLPPEQLRALKHEAVEKECAMGDLIRDALNKRSELEESLALRDAAYDHQIQLTEIEMRNRDRYKAALEEIATRTTPQLAEHSARIARSTLDGKDWR